LDDTAHLQATAGSVPFPNIRLLEGIKAAARLRGATIDDAVLSHSSSPGQCRFVDKSTPYSLNTFNRDFCG
jgi:hypothetical protein